MSNIDMNEALESLDTVPLSKIEDAIESIKRHCPGKSSNDIQITFEYLIGSFYPNVLNNIKEAIKDAHTAGYIQCLKDKTTTVCTSGYVEATD